MKTNKKEEKPLPAPDYYQVTHLAASAVKTRTLSITRPRPFECDVCGSCWSSNADLAKHMYVHTGEKPFRCSYCPRSFRQLGTLYDHERMHRGDRPHACPNCSKTYIRASEVRKHIRRYHLGLKLYDCPHCPEKFYDATEVRLHGISSHGGEHPFSCSLCDKKCLYRSEFNKHLKAKHGILLPYSCSKCDQKFRLINELLVHEGIRHNDDEDPETGQLSIAKKTIKVPLSEPLQSSAKSRKNEKKVTSPIPGAKFSSGQEVQNSGCKLIKQKKPSKIVEVEKGKVEPEEEISILYEAKKQIASLVETKQVDKSIKKKKSGLVNSQNQSDSMTASSPIGKMQAIVDMEPTADDQKDKSSLSSSKKFHCGCGKSYKSIDKFQRHQQRNEGHQDAKFVLQQPSPMTNVEGLPNNKEPNSKKIKLETVQDKNKGRENAKVKVENVKSEENPLEESAKKRKRMRIKTEAENENPSTVPESPPKKKRRKLTVPINDERESDEKTEMCEESFKKRHHCICGKSYKSIEKFQRHQQRNGHHNEAKAAEGNIQQSPSSQNAASSSCFKQFTGTNQEEEKYYHQAGAKILMLEKGNKSKLKQVQKLQADEKPEKYNKLQSNTAEEVVKSEHKEMKREKAEVEIITLDTKSENQDLKIKTELSSFDDKCSKNKKPKKINDVDAKSEYKEKENKVNPSSKCEVQKHKIKREKVNEDEKSIPNNELKGDKTLKVKKKEIKTELSTTTSQLSTINRDEKKKEKRIKEDLKEESQEDEIEIVEIKLTKKQDEKNVEEKCSCGKLFSSPEKFQRHREKKGHHIPKTYKCFCSSQVFNTLEEFRSHMWANHRS